jgi:LEA14-like dessication related protein
MYIYRRAIIILLAASLTACAGMRPEPPEVQLSALEITDVSLSHANFLATLKLFNPNSFALDIERLKFTLFLNDVRVSKGMTAKTFSIPAEGDGEASVRLSSSVFDLFQLTRTLQNQDEITFRIAGEVNIDGPGKFGTTISIDREGVLPLSGSLNQLLPAHQPSQLMAPLEDKKLLQ